MDYRKSVSVKRITSKDNAHLKVVRALVRSKKERKERSCFVVEGVRALRAFVEGKALPQYALKEIWVSADSLSLADRFDVPVFSVPQAWMEQLSDCRASQGILGVVDYAPAPLKINPEEGSYLLVDHLRDPGNLGTLIRSVVAFGFDGLLLYGDCVEVFNPKTVRATMGALPFCHFQALEKESPFDPDEHGGESISFQTLNHLGYELISTVMEKGESLHQARFGQKKVLIIGNEACGISAEMQRRASRQISIPISGQVESLNAAVAGSICMFCVKGI